MKNLKRALVIVLTVAMVFSMVACGGKNENNATVAPIISTPVPDYSTLSGIADEQLSNYIVKYSVTTVELAVDEEGNIITDEFGIGKTQEVKKDYIEVGFTGYIIKSQDGGTSYALDPAQTSCFTIESQNDPRGLFSANAKFTLEDGEEGVTKGADGTVAGFSTTTYTYKSGLYNYDMYVNGDYKVTLKYVNNNEDIPAGGFKMMEVTELTFGTVTNELFQELFAKQATPVPATEVPAE